jgi:hypothetical protein
MPCAFRQAAPKMINSIAERLFENLSVIPAQRMIVCSLGIGALQIHIAKAAWKQSPRNKCCRTV